jgi:hypothetical protein
MNHKKIMQRRNPKIPLILKTDEEDEETDGVKSMKSAIKQKNTFQSNLNFVNFTAINPVEALKLLQNKLDWTHNPTTKKDDSMTNGLKLIHKRRKSKSAKEHNPGDIKKIRQILNRNAYSRLRNENAPNLSRAARMRKLMSALSNSPMQRAIMSNIRNQGAGHIRNEELKQKVYSHIKRKFHNESALTGINPVNDHSISNHGERSFMQGKIRKNFSNMMNEAEVDARSYLSDPESHDSSLAGAMMSIKKKKYLKPLDDTEDFSRHNKRRVAQLEEKAKAKELQQKEMLAALKNKLDNSNFSTNSQTTKKYISKNQIRVVKKNIKKIKKNVSKFNKDESIVQVFSNEVS